MDLAKIVVDALDACQQLLFIILKKPFLSVKVQSAPQRGRPGQETEEPISFTIANESSSEMEVQRIWFRTSFNRLIFPESIESKLPVKMSLNDRVTYPMPVEELKTALNQNVGDTITEVVVYDQNKHENIARFNKAAQAEFSK
jgi:hypothetical protein